MTEDYTFDNKVYSCLFKNDVKTRFLEIRKKRKNVGYFILEHWLIAVSVKPRFASLCVRPSVCSVNGLMILLHCGTGCALFETNVSKYREYSI